MKSLINKTIKKFLPIIGFSFSLIPLGYSSGNFEQDVIKTASGDLTITFIGHGTLMFKFNDKVIHVDPTTREADYSKLPKADIVLITHHHGDHFDRSALDKIIMDDTKILLTQKCLENSEGLPGARIMKNGDRIKVGDITVEAVPAYNIEHKRANGGPFHPKGEGNGYVLTIGDKRVYIGGDTENTSEMKALKDIDIAFLPMNLPYTMTPEMVADAAGAFKPKILYPYHFGDTDTNKLIELLKNEKDIEIRIRKMK